MGAFVYLRHSDAERPRAEARAHPAVAQMALRGLELKNVLSRPGFALYVYRKRRFDYDNLVEFGNGDFIAATGTLFYSGQYGEPALRQLFDDFRSRRLSFENLCGQFAVWIYTSGELTLFNDYRGLYQVYHSPDYGCISSSFLALYTACGDLAPCRQEVYEYLAFSMFYGTGTVVRGMHRLDRSQVLRLLPSRTTSPKPIRLPGPATASEDDFANLLEFNHERLCRIFGTYVDAFGDRISIGLTGGYDSRLILAYLRHCGSRPRVYVQGLPGSADVITAKAVAAAAGFGVEHDADEAKPEFRPETFEATLLEAWRYVDGLSPSGLFQNWSLVASRRAQVERPERLRLYGMAGEMYRRSLALPNRRMSFHEFFTVQADKLDTASFGGTFDKAGMYRAVGDKMMAAMALPDRTLSPVDAELTYPHFRLACNSGWQMSAQNERAHALVPFGEPLLSHAASYVGMRYRRRGRFQAALTSKADPLLARLPLAYGFAPVAGPGWRARIREIANESVPIGLRPHLHRRRTRRKRSGTLPFYLQDDYLAAVFPDGAPHVAEYIDLRRETNPAVISRALTLEIVLAGRFR